MTNQILFEGYLQSRLKSEALNEFKARLTEDNLFREEFELYKEMENFMQEHVDNKEAMSALQEVAAQERQGPVDQIKSGRNMKWIILVLVLGLTALLISIMGQGISDSKHKELMAMIYTNTSSSSRSVELPTATLEKGIHYFNLMRMEESKELFTTVLAQNPNDEVSNRYMAYILFSEREYKQSLNHLKKVKQLTAVDISLLDIINKE